jgi:RHS repeat-associated protein
MLAAPGSTSYKYDGHGNRIQQTVSSVVTDYLNDLQPGLTKLLRQDDGTNVDHFIHALRGIHAVDDGTDWNFYAQDGLGSVRAVVDDMAVVQSSMSFDPYGNPMASYGDGFGFTGEQIDENDLVYLRARYMNPNLGTFLSLDPFEGMQGRPMSLNRYSWVEGNPVMNVDASGKCTMKKLNIPATESETTLCNAQHLFLQDVYGLTLAVNIW